MCVLLFLHFIFTYLFGCAGSQLWQMQFFFSSCCGLETLSFSMQNLVPCPGIEPRPPALETQS